MNSTKNHPILDKVALTFAAQLPFFIFWLVRTGVKGDTVGYGMSLAALLLATIGIAVILRKLAPRRRKSVKPVADPSAKPSGPVPDTSIVLEMAQVLAGKPAEAVQETHAWSWLKKAQAAYCVVAIAAAFPAILFIGIENVAEAVFTMLLVLGMLVVVGWLMGLTQPNQQRPSDGKKDV